jgi:ATP-dependent protease Clp ATPase subunit
VFFTLMAADGKAHCAFCKKSSRQVNHLAATDDVAVCDGCIGRCRTIMSQAAVTSAARRNPSG